MQFPKLVKPLKFYAVVPTADWVERMAAAGADTMQLRNKTLHGDELRREIERCVAACADSSTQLFINDHWQMAIEAGAYGVHLGQEDMDTADLAAIEAAGLRLGLSTHSVAELDRALSVNPSYVASGAIFPTTTKQMPTAPQGLDNLRQYVRQAGDTPVVAIGGIDLNNARGVLATGVSSLAVVRAVTEAENPEAAVKAFQALWEE
ncbi:thiamine phosphate synthase [Neisseria sp. CCUG12390]|uniref:thiamine phosphate synthase n=1 Tax=Neisseria sp. CCUG12390 TaxID=3392035 RepID=UPI003A101869